MAAQVDIVGSSNGCLGSGRNLVWVGNTAWAFAFDSTQTLASYYSVDLVHWLLGPTHTLINAHNGEGRNLSCGHAVIAGQDVIWVAVTYQVGTSLGTNVIRASVVGTSLVWHLTETVIGTPTTDGDALYYAGSSVMIGSDGRVHLANSYAGPNTGGNGDVVANRSTVDAGGSEQQLPLTWTGYVIDSSVAKENRSTYLFDRGSGLAGLINDDGAGAETTTGLDYHFFNGSSWNINNTNNLVTGSILAIDKNDWGAVELSTTVAHVVYRNATGSLLHRVWNGSSWNAGDVIPALATASGTGIALATDGSTVYMAVIANDGDNSVRCITWRPGGWDLAWTMLQSGSASRAWISCAKDVASGNFLACWHEGTTLQSAYYNPSGASYTAYYPYWFNAMRVM